jgi:hypothetical protein
MSGGDTRAKMAVTCFQLLSRNLGEERLEIHDKFSNNSQFHKRMKKYKKSYISEIYSEDGGSKILRNVGILP